MSRCLAGVLATWLAICLAEPAQLHTCTMHGGLAIVPGTDAGTHDFSSATDRGATGAATGHSHHDQGNDSDGESRQCSCFGDCNTGSAPIGVAASGISLLTVAVIETSATAVIHDSPRAVSAHFLLPFSNGPPAGSSRA
jgi:hypothetical protein